MLVWLIEAEGGFACDLTLLSMWEHLAVSVSPLQWHLYSRDGRQEAHSQLTLSSQCPTAGFKMNCDFFFKPLGVPFRHRAVGWPLWRRRSPTFQGRGLKIMTLSLMWSSSGYLLPLHKYCDVRAPHTPGLGLWEPEVLWFWESPAVTNPGTREKEVPQVYPSLVSNQKSPVSASIFFPVILL